MRALASCNGLHLILTFRAEPSQVLYHPLEAEEVEACFAESSMPTEERDIVVGTLDVGRARAYVKVLWSAATHGRCHANGRHDICLS